MAIQIKRKFIEDQAIDSSKVDSSIALSADLAAEEARALAAEGVIAADLAAEVSRATAAEGALQSSISSEAATREAADLQHSTAIQNLETGLAQTNSNLSSESTARGLADADLQNQINNILSNVDPAALDSLTEVVAAFQAADSDLNDAITTLSTGNTAALNQEIADRIAADDAIAADLATEVAARIAAVTAEQGRAEVAEAAIAADLADEVARAVDAELVITGSLAVEQDARIAADGVLAADLAQEVSDRVAAVNNEETRAMLVESALQLEDQTFLKLDGSRVMSGDLDFDGNHIKNASSIYYHNAGTSQNEAIIDLTGRQLIGFSSGSGTFGPKINWGSDNPTVVHNNAINPLSSEIATAQFVTDAVLAEQTARESADGIIAADLAQEVLDRAADVDAEETRAMAAENVLTVDLAAEVSRATGAEGVLQANINVEKGRIDAILLAADADKDSFAEIVALINSVDTANDSAFASYVLSNDAALAAETQARSQSDNNIFIAINQEISNRQAADALKLDLAGGTMSGNIEMQNYAVTANNVASGASSTLAAGSLAISVADMIMGGNDVVGIGSVLDGGVGVTMQTSAGVTTQYKATGISSTDSISIVSSTNNVSLAGATTTVQASTGDLYLYAGAGKLIYTNRSMDLNGLSIHNVGTPAAATDAVNRQYVDDAITGASGDIAALTADLAAEVARATAAEGVLTADLAAEVARATAAEGVLTADLAAEVTRATGAESALDARVDLLEADHYRFAQESFVLGAGDSYVDLAHTIEPASLNMYVDRLAIHETDDYTVSFPSTGVTRITFVGSLVTPGQEQLSAGDVIKAKYAYRV